MEHGENMRERKQGTCDAPVPPPSVPSISHPKHSKRAFSFTSSGEGLPSCYRLQEKKKTHSRTMNAVADHVVQGIKCARVIIPTRLLLLAILPAPDHQHASPRISSVLHATPRDFSKQHPRPAPRTCLTDRCGA